MYYKVKYEEKHEEKSYLKKILRKFSEEEHIVSLEIYVDTNVKFFYRFSLPIRIRKNVASQYWGETYTQKYMRE